jgi:two-component system CheB/CheR fusion protein
VKIYATDTDESALARGRAGTYKSSQLEGVPADKRDRYCEATTDGFIFRSDVRRAVIFGRHDITRDAPISRLDLLVCRNVLMYLVHDTQSRVLSRFHYALNDHGYLFLGKAETIFAHADLFTSASPRFRVFTRSSEPVGRALVPPTIDHGAVAATDASLLRELASAATPVAQFVIDVEGTLVDANTRARAMFGVTGAEIGRPFRDLEASFRPIELRSHIEQAYGERRPVTVRSVERPLADSQPQFLEMTVAPLADVAGVILGASITFADVTDLGRTKADLERSGRELASSNESLHSANEELETSNEELQSTNEELETTNEELQSANEELETMNEELQSANEELETMNEELLDQAKQIAQSGLFLAALLNSLSVGVVVVNDKLDVLLWNRAMEDLFGVRTEEATTRSFLALDIGVPVGDIGPLLHAAAKPDKLGPRDMILNATNRKGRPFRCRVTVAALANGHADASLSDGSRFVVLMDPLPEPVP